MTMKANPKTAPQQMRSKAQRYAVNFLMQKYRDEYQELYNAYLVNRGYETQRFKNLLVDERLVMKGKTNGN